jgi:hypothetical protein
VECCRDARVSPSIGKRLSMALVRPHERCDNDAPTLAKGQEEGAHIRLQVRSRKVRVTHPPPSRRRSSPDNCGIQLKYWSPARSSPSIQRRIKQDVIGDTAHHGQVAMPSLLAMSMPSCSVHLTLNSQWIRVGTETLSTDNSSPWNEALEMLGQCDKCQRWTHYKGGGRIAGWVL